MLSLTKITKNNYSKVLLKKWRTRNKTSNLAISNSSARWFSRKIWKSHSHNSHSIIIIKLKRMINSQHLSNARANDQGQKVQNHWIKT